MYYIGEGIELNYLEAGDKFNFDDFLNKKRFTVKDTPLSYRQVNSLDEDKLLNNDRSSKTGWRKFSFKELVYILLVNELKKFGVQHQQMKELLNYFLSKKYSYLSDLAIGCVLGEIEITINIDSDGNVDIFDHNFITLIGTSKPHIRITLNNIVNNLIKKTGKSPFPMTYSIMSSYMDRKVLPKEEELIKIIRDKTYNAVTVKKKNGEVYLVHAEKANDPNRVTTETEIMDILKTGDFQDINIIKRDGRIVNYKVEETIKL